ncbi:hypothetical protein F5X97DRAFT_323265 [Nemania serpens]|nr:hypothetical protein F5X97DRAFT_323265 [Nemania serpens]
MDLWWPEEGDSRQSSSRNVDISRQNDANKNSDANNGNDGGHIDDGSDNQISLQSAGDVAGSSGQLIPGANDALFDYGPTNVFMSPFYVPAYINHIDPETNWIERKLLHLLLKMQVRPTSIARPQIWHSVKQRSLRASKFELEIVRVFMKGTDNGRFRADIVRKFFFLDKDWKFSRHRENAGGKYEIHDVPPVLECLEIAEHSNSRMRNRAEYTNQLVELYMEARSLYLQRLNADTAAFLIMARQAEAEIGREDV